MNLRRSRNVSHNGMPFCTSCGNEVGAADKFCARCGAKQSTAQASTVENPGDPLRGISARTASVLCYIPLIGWLAAIVVLASPRFLRDRTVRFHAFQGLYLFVAWLLVEMVVGPMMRLGNGFHVPISGLLHLVVFAAWIIMLVKTSQDEFYSLPIIGELAERSVAEQRQP